MTPPDSEPFAPHMFPVWMTLQTRWKDGDAYGHMNNAEYYSLVDTAIARWLTLDAGHDVQISGVIGVCATSSCRFLSPLEFPQDVDAGVRVSRIGRSSVHYEVALLPAGGSLPSALATFVHVFVDKQSRRPVPVPSALRARMTLICPDS